MKRRVIIIALVCVGILYFGLSRYLRQERIKTALEYGHLATLPPSATRIEVDTEGNLFSRTFWLTFQASESDINGWIRRSPSLAHLPAVPLPSPHLAAEAPDWFTPSDIAKGEMFTIEIGKEALYGTVWVDRRTNKVYIKTSYS